MRCLLLLIACIPLLAQTPAQSLKQLFDEDWEYTLKRDPVQASQLGDLRYNSLWPDVSLSAITQDHERARQMLRRLQAIPRTRLSAADQLNYDLFQQQYKDYLASIVFQRYLVPMNTYYGIHYADNRVDDFPFSNAQQYRDYVKRLETFPQYMDQTIALLREGVRTKMVQPKIITGKLIAATEKQLVDARESRFYQPFQQMPASIPEAERSALQEAGLRGVETAVLPAYRKLLAFLKDEYLPAGYERPGVWQAPRGKELYTQLAREFTTTDMTPQEIHDTGLREVARIKDEMYSLMRKTGFQGSLQEFFAFLRRDPRFTYANGDELLEGYRALSKRIDGNLHKVFYRKTMPRMPYGVQAIPESSAPFTTTAYYNGPALDGSRAGTFFVNLYKPETRYKYEMMSLSLHEAVPGHHFQIALQQELGDLPNFRKNAGYTAFVEGWALYAETLGNEMGLYEDPYSAFGRLTYDMWRAVRLVVDTGMHYLDWDRDRAIAFFKENAPKSDQDIVNEIDRYISWPGQALGYKVGELKIWHLRRQAQQRLGDRFDLKEFHHQVLSAGALPLSVLETRINDWVAKQAAAPSAKPARN